MGQKKIKEETTQVGLRKELDIFIDILPTTKGRPRFSTRNGYARAYTPKKTEAAEQLIRAHLSKVLSLSAIPHRYFEGALSLSLEFVLLKPLKGDGRNRNHPSVRPDLDNYAKLVMDAANNILWKDDAQIVELNLKKRYAGEWEEPGVGLHLKELA